LEPELTAKETPWKVKPVIDVLARLDNYSKYRLENSL
jgi:hypothetical protein